MKSNHRIVSGLVFMLVFTAITFIPTLLKAQDIETRTSVSKRTTNTDSLALVKQISKDSLKLVELESQLELKTRNKENTILEAQRLADKNSEAARKLSQDPQDKKLARKADNISSEVRELSREARKAKNELDNLNENIKSLRDRITKEKIKLEKFQNSPVTAS